MKLNPKTHKMGLIFDNSGAIYIGYILSETPEYHLIYNPAQLFYKINEESQDIEINMLPICFPEILSNESKEKGTTWVYSKSNAKFVSYDNLFLNESVIKYYDNIFLKQKPSQLNDQQ